jgi:hypothetical protein
MKDATVLFHQVEIIFQKAMEAPASLRSAVLEAACQGNAELLQEVQSLLRACEQEEIETALSLPVIPSKP